MGYGMDLRIVKYFFTTVTIAFTGTLQAYFEIPKQKLPPDKTLSKISYVNQSGVNGICKGEVTKNAKLESVNLSNEELAKGIFCTSGDFDGNGVRDFTLYGGTEKQPAFHVLFFEAGKIIRVQTIREPHLFMMWIYNRREKEGPYGEPATDSDGLVQPGEGGTSYYYIYNKKTKSLDPDWSPSE